MTPSADVSRHQPVMVEQVLEMLSRADASCLQPGSVIVDGTVGGGGHARFLLERLQPDGVLVGFDRDPQALKTARSVLGDDARIRLIHDSYAEIGRYLDPESACAVLLDLGLSSDQLQSERGFSYMRDDLLDMRFDPMTSGRDVFRGGISAFEVVNRYSVARLRGIFFQYGEEPLSPRIARQIDRVRSGRAIRTTGELAAAVKAAVPERFQIKALARIFQAIRIEVNAEIEHLERGLEACWQVLQPGGVFIILSYHSLENRRVKRFFAQKAKGCICPPRLPVCACGRKPSAKILTASALSPSPREIRVNPQSRSARLRAALKVGRD
jgi:16S rRNA (cytosine1402-N4)-methyltransferase